MHVTQWKEPALSWNGKVAEDGRASILEIRSDDFMPQFLQAMAGTDPAAYYNQHLLKPAKAGAGLKLYQPLHGCFYLVTASLVCRQLGLPDKAISRANGESVFFVIRRRTAAGEEAWIQLDKGGYWQPLKGEAILSVAPGEERLPMHPVQIQPRPASPHSVFTDNIQRDVHYGYIPTGNRDKYRDTLGRTLPAGTSPQKLVNDFIKEGEASAPPGETFSFRSEMFYRRVYLPWDNLRGNLTTSGGKVVLKAEFGTTAQIEQLYMLLELGDFLKNNLPTFWAALEADDGSTLPAGMVDLFNALTDDLTGLKLKSGGSDQLLGDLVLQYKGHFDLLRGLGEFPTTDFDFRNFSLSNLNTLRSAVDKAVTAESQPIQVAGDEETNELVRLITHQVQPRATSEPLYHIRTVYEYDPECPPVVSPLPSQPFQLMKFMDPEAPARLVRLEAPSIKAKDLRRYARGVGIEMSPELHKLSNCLSGGDVQGVIDSLTGSCDDGWSIQMICSFSIQIIFLVAFIVMFIFLIALNFIFGWLAFLRICLPIPVKD